MFHLISTLLFLFWKIFCQCFHFPLAIRFSPQKIGEIISPSSCLDLAMTFFSKFLNLMIIISCCCWERLYWWPLFRWIAYLNWGVWNGFQDFSFRCKETPVWKDIFGFPCLKSYKVSFSCELSLQTSDCVISSLDGIVSCC